MKIERAKQFGARVQLAPTLMDTVYPSYVDAWERGFRAAVVVIVDGVRSMPAGLFDRQGGEARAWRGGFWEGLEVFERLGPWRLDHDVLASLKEDVR